MFIKWEYSDGLLIQVLSFQTNYWVEPIEKGVSSYFQSL